MQSLFTYLVWVDLAFNVLSLVIYFTFSDRIGYKIQTFGLVYLFIILGLIALIGHQCPVRLLFSRGQHHPGVLYCLCRLRSTCCLRSRLRPTKNIRINPDQGRFTNDDDWQQR
jgi:hypothetical protein